MRTFALAVSLTFVVSLAAQDQNSPGYQRLVKEVRHELVMLPNLNTFDNLSFRVDGSTVTLMGHVTRPVLKSDAENVVKRIEGVEKVVNQIEVLPLSPNDDRIRRAVYLALVRSAATAEVLHAGDAPHSYHREERQRHPGRSGGEQRRLRCGQNRCERGVRVCSA